MEIHALLLNIIIAIRVASLYWLDSEATPNEDTSYQILPN